jgi:hypothetical protein
VWTTRWAVAGRRGADLEVVFVQPASPQTGVLIVPATDPVHGRARQYPLLAGYLDPLQQLIPEPRRRELLCSHPKAAGTDQTQP